MWGGANPSDLSRINLSASRQIEIHRHARCKTQLHGPTDLLWSTKVGMEVTRVGPVGGCHGDGGGGVGVCALTLGPVGIPPFKQRSEGLMKCEIKLIRRCFVPPHHFITTEMEPTAKGSPVI